MSIILKVIFAILIIYIVTSKAKKCDGKTCAQCIGESVDCVWCSTANHSGPRCQTDSTVNSSWCKEIENPQNDIIHSIRNDKITPGPGNVVQLAPQELQLQVRPGQTQKFTIQYKPAKDYPLDVYYLMDASYSMLSTIELLKQQGQQIYKSLNKLTNNVRLGIGSFVEKAALPFANPNTHFTYAFKHHLNLTTDRVSFENVLKLLHKTKLNGKARANYDVPEAGLDALMQVMTCRDEIGWRHKSRKIVVLCTDSTYHSAGDGKIGGAAKLNDMDCHLNNDGGYTLELEQDYPTINQIQKIAKRENIIVIFNVKENVIPEYKALADTLNTGAEVIALKESSNITKILTDVYTKKLANVLMDVHAPPNVRVKLTPDCTVQDTCEVAHATTTNIEVSVTADVCLKNNVNNSITIKPNGLRESVTIKIDTLCECGCEKNPKLDATECNSHGSLVCGICKCNPNHFGDKCDCIGSSSKHSDDCKEHPEDTVLCNGVGICSCGKCDCGNSYYSGDFCQYDSRACPKGLGKICSDQGECKENTCQCFPDWKGLACECPLDDKSCRAPYSDKVCSGNGICDCGECNCTRIDSRDNLYFGPYCDNCYDCDDNRCKALEKYVLCVYETAKEVCDAKFNTKKTEVEKVNKTEINSPKYHLAKRCTVLREDGKSIIFKHKYEKKYCTLSFKWSWRNQTEPICGVNLVIRFFILVAIGSSIGAILLIGLVTVIIWKCLVDMYDAREYDRFNKLLDESGDIGNINEIYKAPTANFMNPMFNRRSRISMRPRHQ